jgi:hypothetical protein
MAGPEDPDIEFFETREEAEAFIAGKTGKKGNDSQYKVNVDLLRKLSPSTWCTSGGMAEHYVENYDNYVLIVNGVTVAGIEALPASKLDGKVYNYTIEKIGDKYRIFINGKLDEYILSFNTKEAAEESIKSYTKVNKRKVKEVTSRANNGMAPIDYIDDIIAFFEKHNLDLNNKSIEKALKAKEAGKVDKDYSGYEDEEFYYPDYGYYEEEDRGPVDNPGIEYQIREEQIANHIRAHVRTLQTEEEVLADFNVNPDHLLYFYVLNQELRDTKLLANLGVDYNTHNITFISPTVPFYNELAIKAVTRTPYVFSYISEAAKELPGLRELYNDYIVNDDLPFSKTDTNLIQGYYDPKNDKVVVVASNTPVNEGAKVAIHEVAHRGMLRMAKELGGVQELGKALFAAEDQLMKKLPELLKRTGHKSLESLMLDYGFTKESEEGKIKLLMELAARWAETLTDKSKPSWWKKLIDSISKWITKFTGKVLNEEEVNELIGGFVRYGVKTQPSTSSQNSSLNQELSLYLSEQLDKNLGYTNPGSVVVPSIKDIVDNMPNITQTDINNKKLEC